MTQDPAVNGFSQRGLISGHALQLKPAFIDEIVANMAAALRIRIGSSIRRVSTRQFYRLPANVVLLQSGSFGDLFDDVPILVAGRKQHALVHARRIAAELGMHAALTLDEL